MRRRIDLERVTAVAGANAMPSRAVDEAWHGFILCTARYAEFCDERVGVPEPWGVPADRVAEVQRNIMNLQES